MTTATAEKLLKAELRDILHDLTDLNSLSLELQFNNENVIWYRHWLLNSISYVILARNALGGKPEYSFQVRDVSAYCDIGDLSELTNRIHNQYKRILLAYEKEVGDELNQILHITEMCLLKMREYAS